MNNNIILVVFVYCSMLFSSLNADSNSNINSLANSNISVEERISLLKNINSTENNKVSLSRMFYEMNLPDKLLLEIARFLLLHSDEKVLFKLIKMRINNTSLHSDDRAYIDKALKSIFIAEQICSEKMQYTINKTFLDMLPKINKIYASSILIAIYQSKSISFDEYPQKIKNIIMPLLVSYHNQGFRESMLSILLNTSLKFYLATEDAKEIAKLIEWPKEDFYFNDLAMPILASNLLELIMHVRLEAHYPDWNQWFKENSNYSIQKATGEVLRRHSSYREFEFALNQRMVQRINIPQTIEILNKKSKDPLWSQVKRVNATDWIKDLKNYTDVEDQMSKYFLKLQKKKDYKRQIIEKWEKHWNVKKGPFNIVEAALLALRNQPFNENEFYIAVDILRYSRAYKIRFLQVLRDIISTKPLSQQHKDNALFILKQYTDL